MASGDFFEQIGPQIDKLGPKFVDGAKFYGLLYADKDVPLTAKAIIPIAAAAAIYVAKHEGIIPNKLPFIGEIDNLAVAGALMLLGTRVFKELVPAEVIKRVEEKIRSERAEREEIIGAAGGNKQQTQARVDSRWEVKK